MNNFEKYLTLWVIFCIIAGIVLGKTFGAFFVFIGSLEIAHINIVVALLIWVMIIPMLIPIDIKSLHRIKKDAKGIIITLVINWLIKPFSMALLGYIFIQHIFAPFLDPAQLKSYSAGLIILAAAPCTAMVFVWSRLVGGDSYFTLTQVALNDLIMIFAFGPIVSLLLGFSDIFVPFDTIIYSVLIYIFVPFCIAQVIRAFLSKKQENSSRSKFGALLQKLSMASLLLILTLIFAFQGETIIKTPLVILFLAIPILIQVFFNSILAYLLNYCVKERHAIAGPSALIGASNFFELAVATSISMFGINSGATLATIVGVLVEVPVMLLLVFLVNKTKPWYNKKVW